MSGEFARLKGFADMFADQSALFTRMESAARTIFPRYGFGELRTPILERTGLFQRSIGSETDVVQKEMFTFEDRAGRSLTMRPEATAGVMRALLEAGLAKSGQVARVFTMGPMFRYERPQKGRMRQFHQINCECLGSDSPYADAELICMLLNFLDNLHVPGLALKMNSLGCPACRPAYMDNLKKYLGELDKDSLCEDCRRRMDTNPLRVLDCKHDACHALALAAPRLLDHVCDNCREHFQLVTELLKERNVDIAIDHLLVRGLDYYMRTTFEVVSNQIGAQTAVAGGGRYDGLVAQLGGPAVPGVGFACGMERLSLLMAADGLAKPDFYIIALGARLRPKAFALAQELRKDGFSGEMSYADGGMKSLMRQAAHSGASFCLILGEDEDSRREITIRNMADSTQECVPQSSLAGKLAEAGGRDLANE